METPYIKEVQSGKRAKEKEKKFLFDKKMTCPVCKEEFAARMVKSQKLHLIRTGRDLRPIYKGIDTGKYDVLVCPHCGYAALARYFNVLTDSQIELIKNKITSYFTEWNLKEEITSYEEAISAYKLAIANAIVKKATVSEKAYISLKMGWIMRGLREELRKHEKEEHTESLQDSCLLKEREYLKRAYDGFIFAMENESYPICGMDESTVHYLTAALAMQLENYENALKLIVYVLHMDNLPDALRQKAEALQEWTIQKKNT